MKKSIADKWADALEGGAFPQCFFSMKTYGKCQAEDSFCALGVLCELHREETGGGKWQPLSAGVGPTGRRLFGRYLGQTDFLPRDVVEWAGLRDGRGICPVKGISIATMNDSGSGFQSIASFIRKNWRRL